MPKGKKVHYLVDGEYTACGDLFMGAKEISNFLSEATCKDCLDTMADAIAAEEEQEDTQKEEPEAASLHKTGALYTLAPKALDKPGTVSLGESPWLYTDSNVPEQVLRMVRVPEDKLVAQLQVYRGLAQQKIPYISFSEEGFSKALNKGFIYRSDADGYKEEPAIVAAIDSTIATLENALKETEEKLAMARKNAPKTPASKAPKAEPKAPETPKAAPSALDAILAAPIGGATIVRNTPPQKALPLPDERSEDAIVDGMNNPGTMPQAVYREFLRAFKQALHEEGLVIVPASSLVNVAVGCGEESPKEEPKPFDPMADFLASIHEAEQACVKDAPKAPGKPKSTLVLGPNVGGKAPKAPDKDIPGNNGKVPVETIKAIQLAWRNKTATQAELAAKYNLNDKKVWYFCNRSKQLI